MPILFAGVALPEHVADPLALLVGGIPGARWAPRENYHLTVRYFGEVEHGPMRALQDALAELEGRAFALTLAGIGVFPPRGTPRSVWVGVDDDAELSALKQNVDRIAARLAMLPDPRKFTPHVTMARLQNAPTRKVAEYVMQHALFRAPPFVVDRLVLFSSVRSPGGSKYRVEAAFPLRTASR